MSLISSNDERVNAVRLGTSTDGTYNFASVEGISTDTGFKFVYPKHFPYNYTTDVGPGRSEGIDRPTSL